MKYIFLLLLCVLFTSAVVADLSGDLRAVYVVVSTSLLLAVGIIATLRD